MLFFQNLCNLRQSQEKVPAAIWLLWEADELHRWCLWKEQSAPGFNLEMWERPSCSLVVGDYSRIRKSAHPCQSEVSHPPFDGLQSITDHAAFHRSPTCIWMGDLCCAKPLNDVWFLLCFVLFVVLFNAPFC